VGYGVEEGRGGGGRGGGEKRVSILQRPLLTQKSRANFNVLTWWKKNSDAYPILSLMARDFLVIPVSTLSSESAFSAAGRILGNDRTSLSPETLEALICAKD
jgi:hypothetical protein